MHSHGKYGKIEPTSKEVTQPQNALKTVGTDHMKRIKLTLALPLIITFILMVLLVLYSSALFYRISVENVYEVGEDKISGIAANLEAYLDTTKTVLWASADAVDFMLSNGASNDEIREYLVLETEKYKGQFDENYTGMYGYVSGEYLDGLRWEPPADYAPTEREWYQLAVKAEGNLEIVPPYIDAQTGQMVISFVRRLKDRNNVLALDAFTTHIQEIIESTDIEGKGYGFIVDQNGTIIAHPDSAYNCTNVRNINGGTELMDHLGKADNSRFETTLNGSLCTVFSESVMNQWHMVIVVENSVLFQAVYSQLTLNIITNTIVFVLIALFYSIAYRNEQKSSREAEALKISEQQKEYEAELLKLEKSAADSANKAKGEFLAQMSHEIRTPINAVLGMNEMVLRESKDESILEYAENIQTAGRTLLSLINSILDFSKIEDGKMEIIPVKYDTISMINNLRNSVLERARSKGLLFTVHADPQLPCMLIGDDVRVSQVIVNLLTNAVKYTETGSVTLELSCREHTEKNITLAVAVKDTGIGIRKDDMEKLFESFSRLDVTRNRNIEGTGLGMAIVTKLLTLMNSKLNVESEYGKGSVFSFEIRQEIADASPIGTELERRDNPERVQLKEYRAFTGASVLVTDDNDMNLKVAKNLLKVFDIKPELAASGADTIEKMRKNHYSIVFLDHMMPRMDGIETLAKLKEEHLIPNDTVMIALTANAVIGAKENYLAVGFDDYLSKPISLDDLREKLEKYLPAASPAPPDTAPADPPAAEPSSNEEYEVMEFSPNGDCEVMEFAPKKENTSPEEALDTEQLTAAGFSAESGLMYCAGDSAFYREMLSDYARSYTERMTELQAALQAEDWKQYQTAVHALKSISKTVGADDVSELAKAQEEAAKQCDAETIRSQHKELETLFHTRTAALSALLKLN